MAERGDAPAGIRLTGVGKTYPGQTAASVAEVSLEIEDGEFLCLLGPSGCGKTTTLRMIAGLETPSRGRIEVGGRVVDDARTGTHVPAERRGLGFVFQNYALWPHLRVRENVGFGPATQRLGRDERERRVDEALRTLSIESQAEKYPSALSGGQQQRVAIARTLAARPRVLLLDEPLSNLDARLRLEMRAEFQRIHRETGATMVFVTHDQWEAMTLATRIVVMSEGRVQQVGTPQEIYEQPVNRFVAEFMGNPPLNVVELDEHGPSAAACAEWSRRGATPAASVGVRPEALRVGVPGGIVPEGALVLDARVTAVLPTGGSWIVEAGDGSRRIFATTQERPAVRDGDEVRLWAPSERVLCFDAQGTRVHASTAVAA